MSERHQLYKLWRLQNTNLSILVGFYCKGNEKRSVPSNCSQYEICVNSRWQRRNCSKQRYYNPEQKQCLEPRDDFVCNYARVSGLPACNNETDQQTLPFKDATKCQQYYRCTDGKWSLNICDEKEFYSRQLRTCLRTNSENICESRNASENSVQAKLFGNSTQVNCRHRAVRALESYCDMYLMCLEGSWWYQYCPLGMYFNLILNYCMPNDEGQCRSVNSEVKSLPNTTENEYANENCTRDGELRPSALACNQYYICVHGKWRQQICSITGHHYNETVKTCQPDANGVCSIELQHICHNGEKREFPLNCRAYEICENGNWQRGNCAENSTYDVLLQECVDNDDGHCALNGLRRTCDNGETRAWPIKDGCTRFYYCEADSWHHGTCLKGHTYLSELQSCVPHDKDDTCKPIWSRGQNSSLLSSDEYTNSIEETDVCLEQADGTSVPHPNDCTRFYLCRGQQLISEQNCDIGSFFDVKLGYCRPNDGSCRLPLTGICKDAKDGELIADALDCRNYYYCSTLNGTQRLSCSNGQYYDNSTQQCRLDHGECRMKTPKEKCAAENAHGKRLPHESYCNIYYACVRGLAIPIECPDGYEFNPVMGNCQLDEDGKCLNGKIVNGNETTNSCSNLTDGTYLPNNSDCTAYYICAKGHAQPKRCASKSYFDSQQLLCVPNDSSCPFVDKNGNGDGIINNENQPPGPVICEGKHGDMFPDPFNCNNFYVCINGKLRHERCYKNYYFKKSTKQCELYESEVNNATTSNTTTESTTTTLTADKSDNTTDLPVILEENYITTQQRCSDKPTNFTDLCLHIPNGYSVAEHDDCRRYISCQDNKPISQRCRIGESYDSLLGFCRQTDGTCLLENGQRVGECNGRHGALTRDAENCRGYFVCINGQKISGECAENEYFDKVLNRCQLDKAMQCSLAAQKANDVVNCKGLSESVLYPYIADHCRSYFMCVKGISKIYECAEGLFFNATTMQCVKHISGCTMPTVISTTTAATNLQRAPELSTSESEKLCENAEPGKLYANFDDNCRSYYVCDGTDSIVYTACPNGTLYSIEKRACAAASHVICRKSF